jgi:hypothetical protein
MITSSTYTSCRRLGNTRACPGNMRALLHAITGKSFFILKACGPLRVTGHVTVNEPPSPPRGRQGLEPWGTWQHRSPPEQGGEVRSLVTHGTTGALPSREARSGALRHVVAPEPSQVGGEVRNHGARGNAGSRFDREAGSRAIGQVAAPEPSRAGRRSPKPCDTWQHQSPPE